MSIRTKSGKDAPNSTCNQPGNNVNCHVWVVHIEEGFPWSQRNLKAGQNYVVKEEWEVKRGRKKEGKKETEIEGFSSSVFCLNVVH